MPDRADQSYHGLLVIVVRVVLAELIERGSHRNPDGHADGGPRRARCCCKQGGSNPGAEGNPDSCVDPERFRVGPRHDSIARARAVSRCRPNGSEVAGSAHCGVTARIQTRECVDIAGGNSRGSRRFDGSLSLGGCLVSEWRWVAG